MKKFSFPFPDDRNRCDEGVDGGNGMRTSVELNRRMTLGDGVWGLFDENQTRNRNQGESRGGTQVE
jgi:hypothetical protein